jgi:hypothetical protein
MNMIANMFSAVGQIFPDDKCASVALYVSDSGQPSAYIAMASGRMVSATMSESGVTAEYMTPEDEKSMTAKVDEYFSKLQACGG